MPRVFVDFRNDQALSTWPGGTIGCHKPKELLSLSLQADGKMSSLCTRRCFAKTFHRSKNEIRGSVLTLLFLPALSQLHRNQMESILSKTANVCAISYNIFYGRQLTQPLQYPTIRFFLDFLSFKKPCLAHSSWHRDKDVLVPSKRR